ncbi:MAG: sugar kinase [Rhizobacter sp.]|nr:sugar kinase [Rhizobacter sp.]
MSQAAPTRPLRVACLGECMVELRALAAGPHSAAPGASTLLAQGIAGDTYNTAVYLRRLTSPDHLRIDYATCVGGDLFAPSLFEAWRDEGIGEALVRTVPDRSTGLYAIRTDAHGEREFSYWRERSAARAYFEGEPSPLEQQADEIDVLYLSGISLAVMGPALPPRLRALLDRLRARGARIVFDNNYRPRLWASREAAQAAFAQLYALADIALVTLDDERAVQGLAADDDAARHALALPCAEVVVKRGARPTLVRVAGQALVEVPVQPVARVVDTTAAGDSFAAGYLAKRLMGAPADVAAQWGNRLAATVIQHPGAIVPREAMGWAVVG